MNGWIDGRINIFTQHVLKIYRHIYSYTRMDMWSTHAHTLSLSNSHTYTHTHRHTHTHTNTLTHSHTHRHRHTQTHKHTHTHRHRHTQTHKHTHIHTHTHTHTHIHSCYLPVALLFLSASQMAACGQEHELASNRMRPKCRTYTFKHALVLSFARRVAFNTETPVKKEKFEYILVYRV